MLTRFLAAHERHRAEQRLDLMQAVNLGFAGGQAYGDLAENLVKIISSASSQK